MASAKVGGCLGGVGVSRWSIKERSATCWPPVRDLVFPAVKIPHCRRSAEPRCWYRSAVDLSNDETLI